MLDHPITQPTGSRRLTLTMLAARDQADQFAGVARGSGNTFRYLAAFQEAEPYLGLPPQAFKLVAWLVKQTMAHDWEQGSRPICWPSAARQAEFLGLSSARIKVLNRALFEAGIFIIRDSETGKRYGRRDAQRRIVEAYGFDLSPLAYRYDEFIRIAAEARAERDQLRALKKRATRARRAIAQAGETLAALGANPPGWAALAVETADLVARIGGTRTSAARAPIVVALEGLQEAAESWLRDLANMSKTSPEGTVDEPHTISTNKPLNPKDTVVASGKSSPGGDGECSSQEAKAAGQGGGSIEALDHTSKVHPRELLELAPRLAEHIAEPYPGWAEIVDAAGAALRVDLGVSQALWGEACRVLGREVAAVTLAIVSTKPKEHFIRGAGGYFAAMIKRAGTGELHLERSLWKLRRDRWPQPKSRISEPKRQEW